MQIYFGISIDSLSKLFELYILIVRYQKDDVTVVKVLNQTKFEFQMVLLSRHRLMQAFQKRKDRYFSANMNYLELEAVSINIFLLRHRFSLRKVLTRHFRF